LEAARELQELQAPAAKRATQARGATQAFEATQAQLALTALLGHWEAVASRGLPEPQAGLGVQALMDTPAQPVRKVWPGSTGFKEQQGRLVTLGLPGYRAGLDHLEIRGLRG